MQAGWPEGLGTGRRAEKRQTYRRSGQSLCGMNQAAGEWLGASGQCRGVVLGAGGQGWVSLVPGGCFHPSHTPLPLPDHQGLRYPLLSPPSRS